MCCWDCSGQELGGREQSHLIELKLWGLSTLCTLRHHSVQYFKQQLSPSCLMLHHLGGCTPRQVTDWRRSYVALRSLDSMQIRLRFASICAKADDKLFRNILCKVQHLLHPLMPSPHGNCYRLRSRTNQNLQLPCRTSSLNIWILFIHMLFKDMNCSQASTQ